MYAICLQHADSKQPKQYFGESPLSGQFYWTTAEHQAKHFAQQGEAAAVAADIINAKIGDKFGASNEHSSFLLQGLLHNTQADLATGTLVIIGYPGSPVEEFPVKAEITAPIDFVNVPEGVTGRRVKARGKIISNTTNEVLYEPVSFEFVINNALRSRSMIIQHASSYFKAEMEKKMITDPVFGKQLLRESPRFYADILAIENITDPVLA